MRLAVIGVGQAGGRVADKLAYYNRRRRVKNEIVPAAFAVNTAKSDLMGLQEIPLKNRVLIGQAWVGGHGVGLDNELGATIMEKEFSKVEHAIIERGTYDVDAFLVIAGLGGGTGSGGAPVLARELKKHYGIPVYGLGILPSIDEGKLPTYNAARSLLEFYESTDSLILFDNEAWKVENKPLNEAYDYMNEVMVKPFTYLLEAGEVTDPKTVGTKVLDASDIVNTLTGFTVIGYTEEKVPRRFFLSSEPTSIEQLDSVTRTYTVVVNAAGKLTTPCRAETAKKAFMLLCGPPAHMNRDGLERARKWLEDLIDGAEVRAGDYPVGGDKLIGIVAFSGVTDIPRVKMIMKMGIEVKKELEDLRKFEESEEIDIIKLGSQLPRLTKKKGED